MRWNQPILTLAQAKRVKSHVRSLHGIVWKSQPLWKGRQTLTTSLATLALPLMHLSHTAKSQPFGQSSRQHNASRLSSKWESDQRTLAQPHLAPDTCLGTRLPNGQCHLHFGTQSEQNSVGRNVAGHLIEAVCPKGTPHQLWPGTKR